MDLTHLRHVLAVADNRSFAARPLWPSGGTSWPELLCGQGGRLTKGGRFASD